MIKVIAKNSEQAIEITKAFESSSADIVVEVKENTTTENSDVIKSGDHLFQPSDDRTKVTRINE